jgi:antitoxin (DNA-binding transcriptional repressor) of toxin-antitoxin stability system
MQQYTLSEAEHHLSDLIDDAMNGKTILIQTEDKKLVQLVPVPAEQKPRKAGSARGLIKMAADFDAPLTDFDEYAE